MRVSGEATGIGVVRGGAGGTEPGVFDLEDGMRFLRDAAQWLLQSACYAVIVLVVGVWTIGMWVLGGLTREANDNKSR